MADSSKKYSGKASEGSKVEEVHVPYAAAPVAYPVMPEVIEIKDFKYASFKPILDKSPFTIGEWAELLCISERTLHRYAKEDLSFNRLQTERILLLEELIDTGLELFGPEGFKQWVHSSPFSLQGVKVLDRLFTHQGIQSSKDVLDRVQHGVPA